MRAVSCAAIGEREWKRGWGEMLWPPRDISLLSAGGPPQVRVTTGETFLFFSIFRRNDPVRSLIRCRPLVVVVNFSSSSSCPPPLLLRFVLLYSKIIDSVRKTLEWLLVSWVSAVHLDDGDADSLTGPLVRVALRRIRATTTTKLSRSCGFLLLLLSLLSVCVACSWCSERERKREREGVIRSMKISP